MLQGLEKLLKVIEKKTEKNRNWKTWAVVKTWICTLLWMVEAEEVIERKGRRTNYEAQL